MDDILAIVIPWIVTTWAIFVLVNRDEDRLPPDQLARAWPEVSKLSAILGFSVLAVPVHFWRTRRGLYGALLGLLWGTAVVALDVAVEELVGWIVG